MDAPGRPWPPPLGTYAEERELFRLLQNMLEELLIHKPDDPIQYMINHLKQNNDDAPRICVLGPPAAGKTTVAMWLCKRLDAIRISQETLLFKEVLAPTEEEKAYKEIKELDMNNLVHELQRHMTVWSGTGKPGSSQAEATAVGLEGSAVDPQQPPACLDMTHQRRKEDTGCSPEQPEASWEGDRLKGTDLGSSSERLQEALTNHPVGPADFQETQQILSLFPA